MAAVTVRNIPEKTHRALKLRAARNGRSTEAEIRKILVDTVSPSAEVGVGSQLAALGLGEMAESTSNSHAIRDRLSPRISRDPSRYKCHFGIAKAAGRSGCDRMARSSAQRVVVFVCTGADGGTLRDRASPEWKTERYPRPGNADICLPTILPTAFFPSIAKPLWYMPRWPAARRRAALLFLSGTVRLPRLPQCMDSQWRLAILRRSSQRAFPSLTRGKHDT